MNDYCKTCFVNDANDGDLLCTQFFETKFAAQLHFTRPPILTKFEVLLRSDKTACLQQYSLFWTFPLEKE